MKREQQRRLIIQCARNAELFLRLGMPWAAAPLAEQAFAVAISGRGHNEKAR